MYDCHSSDNMIVNECKGWELGVGWLGLGGGCVGLVHTGWGGSEISEYIVYIIRKFPNTVYNNSEISEYIVYIIRKFPNT